MHVSPPAKEIAGISFFLLFPMPELKIGLLPNGSTSAAETLTRKEGKTKALFRADRSQMDRQR